MRAERVSQVIGQRGGVDVGLRMLAKRRLSRAIRRMTMRRARQRSSTTAGHYTHGDPLDRLFPKAPAGRRCDAMLAVRHEKTPGAGAPGADPAKDVARAQATGYDG